MKLRNYLISEPKFLKFRVPVGIFAIVLQQPKASLCSLRKKTKYLRKTVNFINDKNLPKKQMKNIGGFEEEGVKIVREVKPQRDSLMDKEVSVKVNPRRLARVGVVIVVLLAVFFLGRFSANNFELTGLATSEVQAAEEPEAPIEEVPEAEIIEEAPVEEVVEVTPEAEEVEEIIITGPYKNVDIEVRGVEVEWMDTWGKLNGFTYSIKNNEAGTILPSYFLVMMEGYKDQEKVATLAEEQQTVKSRQIQSGTIALDKSFNYNEATAGNLENVQVNVILFDIDKKPIASYHQEFNLKR